MRSLLLPLSMLSITAGTALAAEPPTGPPLIERPDAFTTLVNPACSHCRDEAKRRAGELRDNDRVLCWVRGYSDGGAIPFRFFLNPYRVISDSYGVFVADPDAGFARGFAPSYDFRFHGWRNGVMVMRHKDGTLYSCLSGVAFDGPRKGERLQPIPTLVSTWGAWLARYPGAVAYHLFDKYKPVDLSAGGNADSVKSRGQPDPRLGPDELVLGVRVGDQTKAYPLARFPAADIYHDTVGGEKVAIFHRAGDLAGTTAYRPVARQPRKFAAPRPDKDGVSPPDPGRPLPDGRELDPRPVDLTMDWHGYAVDFPQTGTLWDAAGRGVSGPLQDWTLEPVDAVVCKWFAWAAEYPQTTVYGAATAPTCHGSPADRADPNKQVKEVAGTAEFLRLLPKPFAMLKAVDPKHHTVTLLIDGEKVAKVWPVEPDAEVKVGGWWGRLDQFQPGDRVWAWLKLDRQKNATSVVMLADEVSEFDFHGSLRKTEGPAKFTPEQVEAKRAGQKAWLRTKWAEDGLPGTLTFLHVFSGELELALDHEAMRWGRSLRAGDVVHLAADPPIKGVVRAVTAWRERTVVRLVVGELESSELKLGQRLGLKMATPPEAVEDGPYPPDADRPRAKAERVEWFLASVYCACGVGKDTCTGHFFTLASCNPNGCGMPNKMRGDLAKLIDRGLTDRQIIDELVKQHGPALRRPHLAP